MCKYKYVTLPYGTFGWFLTDCNFIFKTGCDMVWLRVSWKKWTGKYIVDRLHGGPYTLSSGLLWLQLSIPGPRKVMHRCMRARARVCVCVLHRKRNEDQASGRPQGLVPAPPCQPASWPRPICWPLVQFPPFRSKGNRSNDGFHVCLSILIRITFRILILELQDSTLTPARQLSA